MPTKSSETPTRMSMLSISDLQPYQNEFQQLGELAGIHMDYKVFRILVQLLNMGVDSNTIFSLLKNIRRSTLKHSHIRTGHSSTTGSTHS